MREGQLEDDDAGRDSVGVEVDSLEARRAEVGIVIRMLMNML